MGQPFDHGIVGVVDTDAAHVLKLHVLGKAGQAGRNGRRHQAGREQAQPSDDEHGDEQDPPMRLAGQRDCHHHQRRTETKPGATAPGHGQGGEHRGGGDEVGE